MIGLAAIPASRNPFLIRDDGFKDPEPELVDVVRAGLEELKRRNQGRAPAPATNPINQHDED